MGRCIIGAPCTANTLAGNGSWVCDNLVIATYMSAKCPVFIAPAMDLDMYAHPSTKENLEKKQKDFVIILFPRRIWELASGLEGQGRLAEQKLFYKNRRFLLKINLKNLEGKTVLITARIYL